MAVNLQVYSPPSLESVYEVAAAMRTMDSWEVWASDREWPLEALQRSVEVSSLALVGRYDGRAICLAGVAPLATRPEVARPWLLGTRGIEECPVSFLRACRALLPTLAQGYRRLENFVLADYEVAVKWIRWLGFEMGEPEPYGPSGALFRRFWRDC